MYVRVTRTTKDKGVLVRPQDVMKIVTDPEVDWYRSSFTYGEDSKEYWESNNESIKNYTGEAWTNELYWDLDSDIDPSKARKAALKLVEYLELSGYGNAIETYFSGNKGYHVYLKSKSKFNPKETLDICYGIAKEVEIADVVDKVVYNVTRIFRIKNTKHQKSNLYKIPITSDELKTLTDDKIRELAKKPRYEEFDSEALDLSKLKEQFKNTKKFTSSSTTKANTVVVDVEEDVQDIFPGLDLSLIPPGHRRCVYILEQGYYGPGERHDAILRLAAFYKGQGYSRKHAGNLIYESLEKRALIYPDAKQFNESECERDIDQIYSKDWKGGTFTCKNDAFLQSKCDHGNGACFDDARMRIRNVLSINQLFNAYVKYGEEALIEYPKFGLPWLDERIRLRPKTFSIIAGANGSGKTSLAMELMETLNKQKIFHVFFSFDMSDSAVLEKLGSKYTVYTQRQIEEAFNVNTYNEIIVEEVKEAFTKNLPYTLFDFTSSATMSYIEQTVLGLKQVYENLQLVIVDYAGRILGEFESQYANSTMNANAANDVAKRTFTHMLFLSQVSRENGDHTDPLRSSRVSKDSGAWEENATSVVTVWRPFGDGLQGNDDYIHLYIAKNRSGSLGENVFRWEGKSGKISQMSNEDEFLAYVSKCQAYDIDSPSFNWFRETDDTAPLPTIAISDSRFKIKGETSKNNSRFKKKVVDFLDEKEVDYEENLEVTTNGEINVSDQELSNNRHSERPRATPRS